MTESNFGARICTLKRIESSGCLRGEVTNIFDHSFNAKLDGKIWNLNLAEDHLNPYSILVNETTLKKVFGGMRVEIKHRRARIGLFEGLIDRDIFDPIQSDFFSVEFFLKNINLLRRILIKFGKRSAVTEALFSNQKNSFFEPVHNLIEELPYTNLNKFERFFGGGEGLTPAWDDFICGVILADRFYGGASIEVSKEFLKSIEKRTTAISFQSIELAAEGKSSLCIERIISKMGCERIASAEFMRALSIGHSSGSDILSGVMACSEANHKKDSVGNLAVY